MTTGKPLLQEVAGGEGQHEAGLGAGGVQAVLQAGKGLLGHETEFHAAVVAPKDSMQAVLQAGRCNTFHVTAPCADQESGIGQACLMTLPCEFRMR